MIKVLMAGAEAAPFAKSGGLGDVLGSLPGALRRQGIDARVVMPLYQSIPAEYRERMQPVAELTVPVSWRRQHCELYYLAYNEVPVYFINNPYYFVRPYMYGFYDEAERYAFFCRAILELLPYLDFQPDILHCHDWHTGMVSVFLDAFYRSRPLYQAIKTVFTVHNLKYQGIFAKQIMGDVLGLSWDYFTPDRVEFYDQVNFMKGGLVFSNLITTVSPTYAQEIQTPFFGENLDGLLRCRQDSLYGIVNGIDYASYNPAADPHIYYPYSRENPRKQDNKLRLQQDLGLATDPHIPLIAMVTRLVSQKGIDLVAHILDEMLALDVQFVVVGTGEERYEHLLRQESGRYPGKFSANICFDEKLSRRVYAGADLFLMPSLFEPCGIAQLIAMRYGALPVVRETGGLKDTVIPYNEFTGEGNGFGFANYNAHELLFTVKKALLLYQQQAVWQKLVASVMAGNLSWDKSAGDYAALYQKLINQEANYAVHQGNF